MGNCLKSRNCRQATASQFKILNPSQKEEEEASSTYASSWSSVEKIWTILSCRKQLEVSKQLRIMINLTRSMTRSKGRLWQLRGGTFVRAQRFGDTLRREDYQENVYQQKWSTVRLKYKTRTACTGLDLPLAYHSSHSAARRWRIHLHRDGAVR